MSIFGLFKKKPKSDLELQSELKALVNKIVIQRVPFAGDLDRYEELLVKIYKRGLEPEIKLIKKID